MNYEGNERGWNGADAGPEAGEEMRHPEGDDSRIEALFDALRAADGPEAPPFARVWEAARARSGRATRRRNRRLAAAAVIVFLAAGSALFYGRRDTPFGPSRGGSIGEWRSPTAGLLAYAGGGLSTADPGGTTGSATGTTRLVSEWSSPTVSLLRPPGGGYGAAGSGGTPSPTETERRES